MDVTNGQQPDDPVKGEWITSQKANKLINGYSTTTTIGGFIGKKHLRDLAGIMGDGYVKYRFYQRAGEKEIGIIFYPSEESQTLLRTGSSSFCPVLCEYPKD